MKNIGLLFVLLTYVLANEAIAQSAFRRSAEPIAGRYVVVLKDEHRANAAAVANDVAREHLATVRATWARAIVGFSAEMPEERAIAMSRDPRVQFVEEDSMFYVSTTQSASTGLTWNVDRIDQTTYPLSGSFSYGVTGAAIRAYVVDTGVMASHDEFLWNLDSPGGSTRVEDGASFVSDSYPANGPCLDAPSLNGGHGTAVASILAGRRMGVAKTARIVPVRVANCRAESSSSQMISGFEYIIDHYDAQTYSGVVNISMFARIQPTDPSVVCPASWANYVQYSSSETTAVENAITSLINFGLPVVVSSNNQNTDARCTTPARMASVITVGGAMRDNVASPQTDRRWVSDPYNPDWSLSNLNPGSNYGSAIDIFAPAHEVTAAYITSTTAVRPLTSSSGTSFAAPHVAGEIARYLQAKQKSAFNPQNAWQYLLNNATSNAITEVPSYMLNNSPNRYLHTVY